MVEVHGHEPMAYRAADSDREETAEILRRAAGDGRISLDELDSRLSAAYGAATYADLAKVTADLPPDDAVVPRNAVVSRNDKPLVFGGKAGNVRRKKAWRVPSRIEFTQKYGNLKLDFRTAEFAAPVTEIDIQSKYGSVLLILPDDGTATVDFTSDWGQVDSRVPEQSRSSGPHLHVTGASGYGKLRIRHGHGKIFRWGGRTRRT